MVVSKLDFDSHFIGYVMCHTYDLFQKQPKLMLINTTSTYIEVLLFYKILIFQAFSDAQTWLVKLKFLVQLISSDWAN